MATKLDELKGLIAEFENVQNKHRNRGAGDTEPDGVFQSRLMRALNCKEPNVPTTADGWELYSDTRGAERAAAELAEVTTKCVELIKSVTIGEAGPIRKYLVEYCWRCSW